MKFSMSKAKHRFKIRASFFTIMAVLMSLFGFIMSNDPVEPAKPINKYRYSGHNYKNFELFSFERGEMHVFYDTEEICNR